MRSISKIALYIFISILAAVVLSCSDSESRLSPLLRHTTVVINLGLPPENPSAYDDSILNKIRRFFVPDAIAQTAPATFGSILVRVSGPDIGTIEQSFGPLGTISLDVPAGSLRQFEVIAYVAPTDPSAALSFRGTAITNLPEGETVSIPVVMTLNETKIVVPDYNNSRIVIINDLSGNGWTTLYAYGPYTTIYPYDIDFDSRGRIFIADYYNANGIIRINNINGANAKVFGPTNVIAVAVDKINNVVYYATSGQLYKNLLDGSAQQLLSMTGIRTINGLDVSPDGTLYIAGANASGAAILHYNTQSGGAVIGTYTDLNFDTPYDVLVRPPYVYVTNQNAQTGYAIYQLTTALHFVKSLGNASDPGSFTKPYNFLSLRNNALIIIDNGFDVARLVSMSDINASGWSSFGTYGSRINEFAFFYSY